MIRPTVELRLLKRTGRLQTLDSFIIIQLYHFEFEGLAFGLIGCVVGASFAVLVAEELFAPGCRLLISATSSRANPASSTTALRLLIDKALRDEGTSYHYLLPSDIEQARQLSR